MNCTCKNYKLTVPSQFQSSFETNVWFLIPAVFLQIYIVSYSYCMYSIIFVVEGRMIL